MLQPKDTPTREIIPDQSKVHVYRAVAAYYRSTKGIDKFPPIHIEKINNLDELHDGSFIAVKMASGHFSIFEGVLLEEMLEMDERSVRITQGTYSFISSESPQISKNTSMQPIPPQGIKLGRDQLSRGIYNVNEPGAVQPNY